MFNQLVKVIPNLFTIGNLLCGVFSITLNMSEYLGAASILIFFSAVLDFLDGRIARKLKVNSEFGIELDSLADIVSFGVAPALLFHTIATPSILTSLAFILFPTMGALRLAKFSIKPTIGYFKGLPIPAAGLSLAGMALFSYCNAWITLILALLMVSPIRFKKF
ncbi:CDP-diacylglycerol--serine O-phosphatidyltransferase [Bacillus cereus]|uniref:CDP-diacylglycerol--serine O-phosphatidyltransferase n=2 Tax=Bacillus cereus group TaxID=86661 RepID=A0A9X6SY57_BACCE|nr:CDP-diacylglycerol--serine O-phosphatidyltransferase [Bacillus cereus]EEL55115.1 CDP-diacylglycerol--serine O-phosphatidyltransferase [Bacillus cereus Rock4-2]MDF3553868.1 CDP-diacylglycerol--serine O-phosphatidyltransferase [Bacillus cereus]MEB9831286.1 CDP-diacylglycerol--serine O-phosphatidyltransferase [Bacillus cereus]PDZ97465.1 CDP-diacylglycerol--serine O-phosphatidyltransferase [Bacillus cereus]PEB00579.1 CDP-diacylglycerol--serine O-phosphatidyltransferase [Bacillus cereus]